MQRDELLPEGSGDIRPKDIECSTLTKILSYKDFENGYKSEIKLAQSKYIGDLNNLETDFEKNVIIFKEADTIFN